MAQVAIVAACLYVVSIPSHATPPPDPPARDVTLKPRPQVGFATYYARSFHGKLTAGGDVFDNRAMVAAHPTHPLGTILRVTNIRNQRRVQVRVVDRGPARGPRARGVIIDLSRAAAEELGFIRAGRTRVSVEVVRRPDRGINRTD